jgi:hypothetical protein
MAQAKEQHSKAFKEGLKIRQEVLGDTYVDQALAGVHRLSVRLLGLLLHAKCNSD